MSAARLSYSTSCIHFEIALLDHPAPHRRGPVSLLHSGHYDQPRPLPARAGRSPCLSLPAYPVKSSPLHRSGKQAPRSTRCRGAFQSPHPVLQGRSLIRRIAESKEIAGSMRLLINLPIDQQRPSGWPPGGPNISIGCTAPQYQIDQSCTPVT